MRQCVLCGKEAVEEHHLIPKFFREYVRDVRDYKILLCQYHHTMITSNFEEIRHKLNLLKKSADTPQKLDNLDSAIEKEYGISTMNAIWEFVSERERKQVPEWLMPIIKRGVREGKRHRSRGLVMINLHKRGFTDEEIALLVMKFNDRCVPPEDMNTVKYHIKNSLKRLNR